MKKFIKVIVLSFFLSASFITTAFASNTPNDRATSTASDPRFIPCPEGGKHRMEVEAKVQMWSGTLNSPGTYVWGRYYVCGGCKMGVAAQYSPQIHGCLGKYRFASTGYNGSAVAVSFGYDGEVWTFPVGTLWDGMDWLD